MNSQRLLQRFLRYVQIDTTARQETDDYPSSPGQFELGRLLVDELLAAGVADARQDPHGVVLATIPAVGNGSPPVVALCAHLDTSPETTGKGVRPQVIRGYAGGDIVLPGDADQVIRQADNPELDALLGRTILTSDGTTLLGADDKAGVAIIMETAELARWSSRRFRHGRCGFASPATRRSAAASTTSIRGRSARPSATRSTARGAT